MNISQQLALNAIILDTETHDMKGLPIEVAFTGCDIQGGLLHFDKQNMFDEFFSIGDEKISLGAMAVHHILDTDLIGKPDYKSFKLPSEVQYIIGHNIKYDIEVISKCGVETKNLKPICTLNIARHLWPELDTHRLEALAYFVLGRTAATRDILKNAHSASVDIEITAYLLEKIIEDAKIESIEQLYALSEEYRPWLKINFGKHRGTAIQDLPFSYVKWLLNEPNIDEDLIAGIYKYHPNYKDQLPSKQA